VNTNRGIAAPTGGPHGIADRNAARLIGVLYIIGTVALVLSIFATDAALSGPAYLTQIAAQPNQLAIGAVLVLLAGFALAMVPIVFWPIGKRYNETLAIGYLVFRGGLETVIYVAGAFGWLVLIALSKEADAGPAADFAHTALPVIWDQGAILFDIGALMFYVLLYQSRLVPRWLSTWGLVGAALGIVPPLSGMFGLSLGILVAPLALQEMIMALWLIARGFSPAAIAAEAANETSTLRTAASPACG
jgi:hypothetical protein